ncbi:HD domain-containing protein [candidate division WOR-3 bacterium]|uniref:HD domain-containing protein n=1 Tax=candidate division WOR-3 bacterium TaxID=2052148 RepID=A0A9D5KA80_UNCW3|nr:HD domain-containing protein [candidate division WOR-3 bacterium]MBD3365343.1 HD domain-containing protein [candidate division WOR-3 bacterium]
MINLEPIGEHEPLLEKLQSLLKTPLYLVGGGVRDLLLDRRILDLDFAHKGSGVKTASKAAAKLGGAFVPLSEADDEARVVINKELILDFKGFTQSIEGDLADRDFTINAMAVKVSDILEGSPDLIDPFNGLRDIKRGLIRKVGPGSITADPLRVLRAYRFAAQLGFEIDPALEREVEFTSLKNVARERISYELMLILAQGSVYPLVNRMIITGLLPQIFPFDEFWTDPSVRSHTLAVFCTLERFLAYPRFHPLITDIIARINTNPRRKALLKLSALFHDVSKPETRMRADDGTLHFYGHDTRGGRKIRWALSRLLRFSNDDTDRVSETVARHMHLHLLATAPELTERAMRRFMRNTGEAAEDIMILDLADGFGTAGRTRHLEHTIVKILELAAEDAKRADFKPLVTGHDLIELGLTPGPVFKEILTEMEELQWEREITTKEEGVALVKEKLERGEYKID